jgi:hypothetical protein
MKRSVLRIRQVIIIINACLFFLICRAQKNERYINFDLGFNVFSTRLNEGPSIASNVGLNFNLTKDQKKQLFYRNYFTAFIIVPPPKFTIYNYGYNLYQDKPILYRILTNVIGYSVNIDKKNKFRWSLGLLYERYNTYIDKNFFVFPGHYIGIENGIVCRFKWLNVSYKHKIKFLEYNLAPSKWVPSLIIFHITHHYLCIEIPLKLKL